MRDISITKKSNPIVYLSGPMRGYNDFNYSEFCDAEETWAEQGWSVLNPANNESGLNRYDLMRLDIKQILNSDAIAMLEGWEGSDGAITEHRIAIDLGLLIFDAKTGAELPSPEQHIEPNILQSAQALVYGEKQRDYGHPFDIMSATGRKWSANIQRWLEASGLDIIDLNNFDFPNIPPEIVAMCMIDLKTLREINTPKSDNQVDIAGYAATIEMCKERRRSIE